METMETQEPILGEKTGIEITHDLTHVRVVIRALVEALNNGPKSRARSLVVTKLEEAALWAGEGLRLE